MSRVVHTASMPIPIGPASAQAPIATGGSSPSSSASTRPATASRAAMPNHSTGGEDVDRCRGGSAVPPNAAVIVVGDCPLSRLAAPNGAGPGATPKPPGCCGVGVLAGWNGPLVGRPGPLAGPDESADSLYSLKSHGFCSDISVFSDGGRGVGKLPQV